MQLLVPLLHPGALLLGDLVAVHDVEDLVTHSLHSHGKPHGASQEMGGTRRSEGAGSALGEIGEDMRCAAEGVVRQPGAPARCLRGPRWSA